MTGQSSYKSFLKQVNKSAASDSEQTEYVLLLNETTVIGRDPSLCNIVLDSTQYPEVSRKHLKISPQPSQSSSGMPLWEVCDLGSRNGIYINGQRLESCQTLQVHDCIKIGHKGPEFIFECQAVNFVSQMSLSDIFPIRSTKVNLRQTGYLVPGVITVIFVVAMLATRTNNIFPYIVATYLVIANEYIIHKIAHKHKPWWLLLSVALATGLPGYFTEIFHHIPAEGKENINIATIISHAFFQKGLLEELFKAVPVLLVYLLGRLLQSPKRELIGVWEPLDGILLGTASGTGFALAETFTMMQASKDPAAQLTLLIPLILGDIFGEVAYSGYFGYFIGLSAMKPSKRWRLLGIGYLTSATIHTLWAVVYGLLHEQKMLNPLIGNLLLAFIGSLAYVFLIAATLKAHHLSPNRSQKSGLHGSPISH